MRVDPQELLVISGHHLLLVVSSVLLAIILGIPLGIAAFRSNRFGPLVLRLTDAVQTIPSLALFGFLIPIPLIGGIGARTAVIALVLYSLLPIVRNTVAGLNNIDPLVRETGVALGMTPRQLLREVELPLATPTIIAGIRIATVVCIGLATIAAFVGGGGLGELILRGVAMVDTPLILAGALPAAAMALISDLLLTAVERRLARKRGMA